MNFLVRSSYLRFTRAYLLDCLCMLLFVYDRTPGVRSVLLRVFRICRSTKPRKRKDKEVNTSYDEPKRHIVLSGKRDIVGVKGKTDMSEDYEKFHEIPPFKVKADPSTLINDEDYPWLQRNKQRTQAKKK